MKTRELSLATFVLAAFGASIGACSAKGESTTIPAGNANSVSGAGSAGAGTTFPTAGSSGAFTSVAGSVGTSAGSGNSTSNGGAFITYGGAGGAPPVAGAGGAIAVNGCLPVSGTIADLAIDDLEDGDNAIQVLGNRKGFWYTYNDGTIGAVQVPAPDKTGAIPFKPLAGGHSVLFSAHTNGPAFTAWGAGMGFDFNNTAAKSCPYDATAYAGIKFWAKGNVAIKAMVKIPATTAGGGCTAVASMCEDHYFLQPKPTLTDTWTQYTIDFASATAFAQEGWGAKVPFEKNKIIGVQFQVALGLPFDFAVDDVTFY